MSIAVRRTSLLLDLFCTFAHNACRGRNKSEAKELENVLKLLRNTDNSDKADNSENTMSQKTSEDYLKELKTWYKQHRRTLHDGLLVEPSNGELRDLCIRLLKNGLSKFDDSAFRAFFKVGTNDHLDYAITKFDIEKFRPIVNFLNEGSQTKDKARLNLIAVLIDFPRRPLSTFLSSSDFESKPTPLSAKRNETEEAHEEESNPPKTNRYLYWTIGLALTAVVIAIIIIGTERSANCMVWKNDHYVSINCRDSTFEQISKDPIDEKQFMLNKVSVSKNTEFFVDGKPQIWYLRHDNEYEFFDQPGYHPLFKNKDLRPVSTYIAMKVVAGEINGR